MNPAPNSAPDTRAQTLILCVLLIAAVLAVYFPVTNFGFTNFDDPDYVTQNPRVLAGLSFGNILWAFRTWHPLTWISLMLDVTLFGKSPSGFHLTNLALHIANCVFLFLLVRKMTGALWRSLIVAALFALHPIQVESVAWIAERKGLLSTLFALLSLWFYVDYAKSKTDNDKAGSRTLYLSLFFFTLGLLSKPILITLPCVMLLLDFWPLNRLNSIFPLRNWLPFAKEKIPFFVLSALSAIVTTFFQKEAGALQTVTGYALSSRIENAFVGYIHYLIKILWPTSLVTPYPRVFHWPTLMVLLAALVVIALCAQAIWARRRHPFLFTGWFWFFGILIPVIGLVQVGAQSVADRYAYLPSIGLFIIAVWGVTELLSRVSLPKAVPATLAVLILVACSLRTHDQLGYWRNSGTLFEHAIRVSENNWLAHYSLGSFYDEQGRTEEAMRQYQRTIDIKPNYAAPWNNIGVIFGSRKDFARAAQYFEKATTLQPTMAEFRYNWARALVVQGKSKEALAPLQAAPPSVKSSPPLLGLTADALINLGRPNEALPYLEQLAKQTRDPELQIKLATLGIQLNKPQVAVAHFREALKLKSDWPEVLNNLAWTLATSPDASVRNGKEAIEHATRACELTQQSQPVFLVTLAAAYAEAGQFDKAIATSQKAKDLATRAGNTQLVNGIAPLLNAFNNRKPFHTPPASP